MILRAADCAFGDLGCGLSNAVGDAATGVVGDFVKSLAEGTISVLKVVNSFWIYLPSPDVASSAITTIQNNLSWYVYAFAVLGLFLAIGRMLLSGDFKGGAPGVKMIVNLIMVTGFYTTAVAVLLKAGDLFAPWIINKATGKDLSMEGLLSVAMFVTPGVGPGLLLVILAFLGAIANVLFMLVRGVMITLLVAFLPILAAGSASETGQQAWNKANGYLIAFLLFKPVAAVILALGLLQITNPTPVTGLDSAGQSLYQVSLGIMTLFMVALALPALVKFVVPVAANGSSMAFSGGAVAAAGVAAGAAVVTLGAGAATGGAAAGASGMSGATGATGASGAGGAATTGTGAAASTNSAGKSGTAAAGTAPAAAPPTGGAPTPGGGAGAGTGTGTSTSSGAGAAGGAGGDRARDTGQLLSGVSAAAGSSGNTADDLAGEG